MILEDIIYYGDDAMNKLKIGVNKVADAVSCTMGPSGRMVLLGGTDGLPLVTKDGVSVANYLTLVDPIENMGAELVKQAAANTVRDAGDGTTTATVLTKNFVHAFTDVKYSTSFREGVELAQDFVLDKLRSIYVKDCSHVEELESIALTSTNGDKPLAKLISKAVYDAGINGHVEIGVTTQKDISVTNYEGYKMNSGWPNSYYINNASEGSCDLKESYLLLIDGKLESYEDLKPLLKHSRNESKALVVVAEDFSEDIQSASIQNFRNGWQLVLLKSENFGDYKRATLEDLAAYVDGKIYLPNDLNTKGQTPKVRLGHSSSIEIYKNYTIIKQGIDCEEEILNNRISLIKTLLSKAENNFDKIKLNVRLNQLSGGYSKINIGGYTESAIKERFDRAEDAIGASQAALKEGVIPGGGNPLWKISEEFYNACPSTSKEVQLGWKAVMKGIKSPLEQLIINTGHDVSKVVSKLSIEQPFYGIEAKTLKNLDLIEMGVIDPLSVTKSAINNSISVALLISSIGATLQNTFKPIEQ